ncbi:hypothetical protein DP73_11170 [Desulfosporosinus sp. HMP52]|uniref:hypothetical protein n=1 Tax=Desulfosporosinus sp. HMP52 TaxID=1487923 RepID=UPI00051F9D75|nr:hypothetical protein [Desulfosporosinus sp. HMP52]KGK89121.1 hypothetical protein DP73_11170 [Desulfosporosinus sp. HMP52]
MSIYKIGDVVKVNDQGNEDFNGLAGVVKKIELGSDDVSILYFVEFQRNDSQPRTMLVFLENELEAA